MIAVWLLIGIPSAVIMIGGPIGLYALAKLSAKGGKGAR